MKALYMHRQKTFSKSVLKDLPFQIKTIEHRYVALNITDGAISRNKWPFGANKLFFFPLLLLLALRKEKSSGEKFKQNKTFQSFVSPRQPPEVLLMLEIH